MARTLRRTSTSAASAELVLAPRRLLLDSHVWLWWQFGNQRLGPRTRSLIQGAAEVRFSAASVWEIAVKRGLGKLEYPVDSDIATELQANGFKSLAVEVAHADEVRRLPLLHNDPFDRMLVAQCRLEGLTLATVDPQISAYDIQVWDATT